MSYPYPYYRLVRDNYDNLDLFKACFKSVSENSERTMFHVFDYCEVKAGALASVIFANRNQRNLCWYCTNQKEDGEDNFLVRWSGENFNIVDEWSMISDQHFYDETRADVWRKLEPISDGDCDYFSFWIDGTSTMALKADSFHIPNNERVRE